jgi:hypothetical protein
LKADEHQSLLQAAILRSSVAGCAGLWDSIEELIDHVLASYRDAALG